MKCLLDIDGVLADFVGGACRAHGRQSPYDDADPETAYSYDVASLWNMTPGEFWAPLDSADFWRGLDLTADGLDILNILERQFKQKNICLLTSPSMSPYSIVGKIQWIREHYPDYAGRCLIGPCKEFCAHRGAILVDDCDANVVRFIEHGGGAILVPRPWNHHHVIKDAPRCVASRLEQMLEPTE